MVWVILYRSGVWVRGNVGSGVTVVVVTLVVLVVNRSSRDGGHTDRIGDCLHGGGPGDWSKRAIGMTRSW